MGEPRVTWNVVSNVRQLFEFPFMVHAFQAGTIIAVVAALIGWYMVLRRQTFAGHTLGVIGFPGASAAALLGLNPAYGYFVFTLGAALAIGVLPHPHRERAEESAAVGTVQALALATGFLFISLSHHHVTGAQALLFGSFLGISSAQVLGLLIAATVALVILAVVARPLLFASIDPAVAAARGVPVPALSLLFLLLLGIAAAETSQITGSLLVFALLVLPAATAEQVTARPGRGALLTVVLALLVTWVGLASSYYSNYPIGFFITSLGFAAYLIARGWRSVERRAVAVSGGDA